MLRAGGQNRVALVVAAGQGPLAVVGAELDRLAVAGRFGDHGEGPGDAAAVLDQVGEQLDHDAAGGGGGGHRFGSGLAFAQPGRAGLHEVLELLVAGDATVTRVMHNHVDRPGPSIPCGSPPSTGPDEGANRVGQG